MVVANCSILIALVVQKTLRVHLGSLYFIATFSSAKEN